MLNFSESEDPPFSDEMDFCSRLDCSSRYPRSAGRPTHRPSVTGSVAHRPWEDRVSYGSRWIPDPFYDNALPGFSGKPKTFKPILLYQRPDEPALMQPPRLRPFCNHHGFCIGAEHEPFYHLQNCQGDTEDNMRDFLSSIMSNSHLCGMGHGMYDFRNRDCYNNCSFGFQHPLTSRMNSCGLTSNLCPLKGPGPNMGNFRRHCHGTCPLPEDSYSANLQTPFSMPSLPTVSHANPHVPFSVPRKTPVSVSTLADNLARTPFPLTTQTSRSVNQKVPKPYFPVFARHPMNLDRGPASEIRRALLLNHPVYNRSCTECSSTPDKQNNFHNGENVQVGNTCFQESSSKFGVGHQASTENSHSKVSAMHVPSHTVLNMTRKADQSPATPAAASAATRAGSGLSTSTQLTPLSPFTPEGGDGWQEWAGRYGSFLQLLNSPDTPLSVDPGSVPLNSLPSDLPEKQRVEPSSAPSAHMDFDFAGLKEQTLGVMPHSSQVERDTGAGEERDSRRHKCPYCDVTCTNNGQLKGHLRVHTGERPYKCECGRAFARNEELTRHRRIHSGLRPHQCNTCGKRFGRKDHLKKHQKTHLRTSEKKIHVCRVEDCRQRYTRSDALARHQWGAHGIKAKTSRIRPVPSNDQTQIEKLLGL